MMLRKKLGRSRAAAKRRNGGNVARGVRQRFAVPPAARPPESLPLSSILNADDADIHEEQRARMNSAFVSSHADLTELLMPLHAHLLYVAGWVFPPPPPT